MTRPRLLIYYALERGCARRGGRSLLSVGMNEKTNSRRHVEVFSCNGEFGNTKKNVLNLTFNII